MSDSLRPGPKGSSRRAIEQFLIRHDPVAPQTAPSTLKVWPMVFGTRHWCSGTHPGHSYITQSNILTFIKGGPALHYFLALFYCASLLSLNPCSVPSSLPPSVLPSLPHSFPRSTSLSHPLPHVLRFLPCALSHTILSQCLSCHTHVSSLPTVT